MSQLSNGARLVSLATIAPLGAIAGGLIDERLHLGFTTWRSACRAAGISFSSLVDFTFELLPNAVVGALLGALLVQLIAFCARDRVRSAAQCLAVHLGCTISMPFGLLLCALAMPVPVMLLAEVALVFATASAFLAASSVVLPTRASRRA